MLAFDDELPFQIDLAAPAFVSNDCGGTVTLDEDDADSGFDIRLTDGMVGAGADLPDRRQRHLRQRRRRAVHQHLRTT